MKKLFLLFLMCIMALSMQAQSCAVFQLNKGTGVIWEDVESNSQKSAYGYVDLGLPSGTKWKATNENGLYDYDTAVSSFGDKLPSKEQWTELKDNCRWNWNGSGYKVSGKNGNFIVLPAAGYHYCGNVYDVGSSGYYWSSTPDVSRVQVAWFFYFHMGFKELNVGAYSAEHSVRLVQD